MKSFQIWFTINYVHAPLLSNEPKTIEIVQVVRNLKPKNVGA